MSKLNYTPGPWEWWYDSDCIPDGEGGSVFVTYEVLLGAGRSEIFRTESEIEDADAALLRHALDMYEALRAIAAFPEGPEVTASFDEPHAAKIARAVLAKIEGPTD